MTERSRAQQFDIVAQPHFLSQPKDLQSEKIPSISIHGRMHWEIRTLAGHRQTTPFLAVDGCARSSQSLLIRAMHSNSPTGVDGVKGGPSRHQLIQTDPAGSAASYG